MRALKEGTSATKLVEKALTQWLDKQQGGVAEPKVITDVKLHEVSVTADDLPWGRVTKVTETPDGLTFEAERIPDDLWISPTVRVGAAAMDASPPAAEKIEKISQIGPRIGPLSSEASHTIAADLHAFGVTSPAIEKELNIVNTPADAAATVEAALAARGRVLGFHPVPKPASKKTSRPTRKPKEIQLNDE
jgi:hypothetical protein